MQPYHSLNDCRSLLKLEFVVRSSRSTPLFTRFGGISAPFVISLSGRFQGGRELGKNPKNLCHSWLTLRYSDFLASTCPVVHVMNTAKVRIRMID
jgi:hypothetical protein